ncbi:MAG: hypothetical protein FJ098_03385 [Deltaproteobacteria bacterium]|nr:hypothetical protein [Deltaproteobacteria bacterium]
MTERLRPWDAPRRLPRGGVAAVLVPGLLFAGAGRPGAATGRALLSGAVTALLLALGLTGVAWPPGLLLLLVAWLVTASQGFRPGAGGVRPGARITSALALAAWGPPLGVVLALAPGWELLAPRDPASLPLLGPGEIAACRDPGPRDPARGALVLAGAEDGRFLGRILGLPGETVATVEGSWTVDGAVAARSVVMRTHGETSVVLRLPGGFVPLHRRGAEEPPDPEVAPVTLGPGEVWVLASELGGAALDSRGLGPFPLDEVRPAACVLLWSPHRPLRIGRPLP